MATVLESVLNSDPAGPPSSSNPRYNNIPSSSRARPPPSSNGIPSEADIFPDDDVVGPAAGRNRNPLDRNIQRVEDRSALAVGQSFAKFLESHVEDPNSSNLPASSAASERQTDKYYINQIHGLKEFQLSTLYVDYKHILQSQEGTVLADAIVGAYYRFLPYLTQALHSLIAKYEPVYFKDHRSMTTTSGSTTSQSAAGNTSNDAQNGTSTNGASANDSNTTNSSFTNPQTDKLFTLSIYNLPLITRVRQLRTEQIGRLVSISGTVTRTSEVRPELSLGTFICEACQTVIPHLEQTFRYTQPTICPNITCQNKLAWRLDIRGSTFVDWQRVRVQENSGEIPTGSMPRTIDVILRGEQVERTKPGEKCIFTGTLIVVPDVSQLGLPGVRPEASRDNRNFRSGGEDGGGSGISGLKSLGVRDLTYRMAFLACFSCPDTSTAGQTQSDLTGQSANILNSLHQTDGADVYDSSDRAQEAFLETLSYPEIEDLRDTVHSEKIYSRLVNSLAPMVYGHEIVKKGLLLQLLGGVSKKTREGMALRGDINICIVGDPSTSKSQFLKYISSFLPRAVYTSGKASSAAGLTAAVVKDEETGEHTIEAGALMLSDSGTCCIDEFDKMEIQDQVAIHEAMEQQTISIAKAGIHATLNARTSILAAANPVGGRYNRKATLRANVNMSAPIMSRFDLFFVVLDECNENVDRRLAEHIVNLHMFKDDFVTPEFSTEQLQRYIRFARTFKPVFKEDARRYLVEKYKELRAGDAGGVVGRNSYRITVRQLESLIRLSEAIAKANCVDDVTIEMVREAFGLLRQSIISVERDDVEMDEEEEDQMEEEARRVDAEMADAQQTGAGVDGEDQHETGIPATTRPKTKITFEKFSNMQHTLATKIREQEETTGEGIDHDELILWFTEQMEASIDSVERLQEEAELAKKVVKRMVKDNIIMPVRGEGLVDNDADDEPDTANEKVSYVLHPNCGIFDDD